MTSLTRRAALAATGALALPVVARAQAAWPARDLRMVCPFPPGGTTDVIARLMAAAMREPLGRNVIVENQPGAGSTLAAGRFAREADDYGIFLSQIASHAIGPALYRDLNYDPERDFRAVTLLVTVPNVIVANPRRMPDQDMRALLTEARAKPTERTFATAGNGTSTHLTGELISQLARAPMTHVPYRGAGPAMTAVVGGEVDTLIDNLPTALPQIRAGTVRPLAVTSKERVADLPDVPALSELGGDFGLEGFEAEAWFGLHAHKSASDAVVSAMSAAVLKALADPAVRQQLAQRGTTPRGGSPDDYAALVSAERARWLRVVREGNITVN